MTYLTKAARWLWAGASWAMALGAIVQAYRIGGEQGAAFLLVSAVLVVNGLLVWRQ